MSKLSLKKPRDEKDEAEDRAEDQPSSVNPHGETAEIADHQHPDAADADETLPVTLDTGVIEKSSLIAKLEARALAAQREGDHPKHALLYQIATTAGQLKQATAVAHGKFDGDLGNTLSQLHEFL